MTTKTVNIAKPYTWQEKIYIVAIVQGLLITLKHFIRGFFLREHSTILYPEVKREYSDRFRGAHFISLDKNKLENCTACYLCQTVCPAECITIIAQERDPSKNPVGVKKEKHPARFDIDALRCCFCGFCEEACPVDAIKLSRNYEMCSSSRDEAIYDLEYLTREVKGRG